MPEVILCIHCRQPINKETDQYVVVEKATDRYLKRWPMLLANKAVHELSV